jgi:hypothetical protein
MPAAARKSSIAFPSDEWVSRWTEIINEDAEIRRLGKWFDASVLFDFGGTAYLLRVASGKVLEVIPHPIWDKAWDFAVRASKDCWEKSMINPPPPFYQDIFAMMWNHGMKFEGNVVKGMQNIRVLKLIMGAMKRV